jgi:site-specific DNA-cytosine methylase
MPDRLRVLELFCGIGGCAAALGTRAAVVAAVDVNRKALAVYEHNFPHPTCAKDVTSLRANAFSSWEAELWWLSPPCQPYTRRGRQRDVADPRAAGLLSLLPQIAAFRPPYVALENVPGFEQSRCHALLREVLDRAGYETCHWLLCPTELGVPNLRRRYYLVASRRGLVQRQLWGDGPVWPSRADRGPDSRPGLEVSQYRPAFRIRDILDAQPDESLWLPADRAAQYQRAFDLVDPHDPLALTTCFTAGYGRALVRSGSYLVTPRGPRRFSPREILRLLCFPPEFSFPPGLNAREAWPLVGNSLSIAAVRHVLRAVPELSLLEAA